MKKEEEETGEQKPTLQLNAEDNWRQTSYVGNKHFKSKVKAVEDDVFKMGLVKNVTPALQVTV